MEDFNQKLAIVKALIKDLKDVDELEITWINQRMEAAIDKINEQYDEEGEFEQIAERALDLLNGAEIRLRQLINKQEEREIKEIVQSDVPMAEEVKKEEEKVEPEVPMQIDTSSAKPAKLSKKMKYQQRLEAAEEVETTADQAKTLTNLQKKLEVKRLAQNNDSFAPIDLETTDHKTRSKGALPSAQTKYKDQPLGGGAGELPVPTMTKVINIMKQFGLDKDTTKDGKPATTGFFDIGSGIGNTLGTAAILTKRAHIMGIEANPQRVQYSSLLADEMEKDSTVPPDTRERFKQIKAVEGLFNQATKIDPAMTHWYAFDPVMAPSTKYDIVRQFNVNPQAKMLVTTQPNLDKVKGDAITSETLLGKHVKTMPVRMQGGKEGKTLHFYVRAETDLNKPKLVQDDIRKTQGPDVYKPSELEDDFDADDKRDELLEQAVAE